MTKEAIFITGLGNGEEAKGASIEWATMRRKAKYNLRSGGSQSGHHLVLPNGQEQMLSHYGSGVFEGATTLLKHMVINPVDLFTEGLELEKGGL